MDDLILYIFWFMDKGKTHKQRKIIETDKIIKQVENWEKRRRGFLLSVPTGTAAIHKPPVLRDSSAPAAGTLLLRLPSFLFFCFCYSLLRRLFLFRFVPFLFDLFLGS